MRTNKAVVGIDYRLVSEDQLLENIRQVCGVKRLLCYHTHRSDRSEPGFPDLVIVDGLQLRFWELKRETGRVKKEQQVWLDALSALPDIDVRVVRPSDWYGGLREELLGVD